MQKTYSITTNDNLTYVPEPEINAIVNVLKESTLSMTEMFEVLERAKAELMEMRIKGLAGKNENVVTVKECKELQESTILSTSYIMDITMKDGSIIKHELTGEEKVTTGCPCGKEHSMTFDDFLEIMKDGELYGTSVYCGECSAKRNRMKS